MPEDIRLAKGEDLDALTEKVNTHIESDEIHVTAEDKENWDGKADLSIQNCRMEYMLLKRIASHAKYLNIS